MTGYDVQLHLRCRNSIVTHEFYRLILTPRMSQIFLEKNNLILQKKESGVDKVVNFKDFSRPQPIQGLFKATTKIQDLFKIVRTMYKAIYAKHCLSERRGGEKR